MILLFLFYFFLLLKYEFQLRDMRDNIFSMEIGLYNTADVVNFTTYMLLNKSLIQINVNHEW